MERVALHRQAQALKCAPVPALDESVQALPVLKEAVGFCEGEPQATGENVGGALVPRHFRDNTAGESGR